MKLLILYHSGTGNTEFACRVTRSVVEKAGHEATMAAYGDAGGLSLEDFDAYCFASPVYAWQPAKNVERFVKHMTPLTGRCSFIVTTSAGAPGQAAPLLAGWLRKKGLAVLGSFNLVCPDSWPPTRRWSRRLDDRKPTVKSVRRLADFVESALSAIEDHRAGKPVSPPRYRVLPTGFFLASRLERLVPIPDLKMGRKKVDEKACTKCRVCEEGCPAGAIRLDPYPRFGGECIACWRCVNTCPEDCITTRLDSGCHYKGITRKDELLSEVGLD